MFPSHIKKLIDKFSALPSVGPKMAERLVMFLMRQESDNLKDFSDLLGQLKENIRYCMKCGNLSEGEFCHICNDSKRNDSILCVVEEPLDIIAIEKTKKYDGRYHVLGGVIEIGKIKNSSQLRFFELKKRILEDKVKEVVLALNPTTEGDATSLYVQKLLSDSGVKITKLARGLSTGADIEYADELTLSSAIINRK